MLIRLTLHTIFPAERSPRITNNSANAARLTLILHALEKRFEILPIISSEHVKHFLLFLLQPLARLRSFFLPIQTDFSG